MLRSRAARLIRKTVLVVSFLALASIGLPGRAAAATPLDLITGADAGSLGPHVAAFDGSSGGLLRSFYAYPAGFAGGVRVASGDVNGDGTDDIVTGAGPGGGPHVEVFDGNTNSVIRSFFAYAPSFTGGVYVAAGDVNGDGKADIVTGAGAGGGPHVEVFDGATGNVIRSFFAYAPGFTGGVRVAAADVNGDGKADIITAPGPGGGPHVEVFDGATGNLIRSFFAYAPTFTAGVFVAGGDVNGDGKADIVTGAGAGGGPHVEVFDGATGNVIRSFFAYAPSFTGGVRVAAGDISGDGKADIVVGAGPSGGPHVQVFDAVTNNVIRSFFAESPAFTGGIFVAAGNLPATPIIKTDWLQFGGSSSHSGFNSSEATISTANVAGLTQKWQQTLPTYADGAPVVATGVQTPSGTQDLVIVTTRGGGLIARNLQTGAAVWSVTFGPGSCTINNVGASCYTTSSPVVDRSTNAVYTYGLDGKVHKVDLGTGTEAQNSTWPVVSTLKPWDEKGSSALSSATAANGHTYLYSVHSGYPGDGGDYQGHLTAIDLATGTQHVFNTLCSNQIDVHFTSTTPDCAQRESGVWARAGVTYSAATNRIYLATGNAVFNGTTDWGDTVLALNPDGTGVGTGPVDSYTPTNYAQLDSGDADLGSTLPALVDAPAGSTVAHVGVQGGKDTQLRLLDLANLSGQGGPGHTGGEFGTIGAPGGNAVLTAPAVWTDGTGTRWADVATDSGLTGYKLTLNGANQPQLTQAWTVSAGGTSPVVANGILYVAGNGTIRAYNATTGAQLWSAATGSIHWQSPVVADGLVLLEDGSGHLTAWGP